MRNQQQLRAFVASAHQLPQAGLSFVGIVEKYPLAHSKQSSFSLSTINYLFTYKIMESEAAVERHNKN